MNINLYIIYKIHDIKNIPKKNDIIDWINNINYNKKIFYVLNIYFVSKKNIRNINHKYRGIYNFTNVITFSSPIINLKRKIIISDIFICKKIIEKESVLYNINLKLYWINIIIHSFLHIIGYNHIFINDLVKMKKIELYIFNKIINKIK